MKRAAVVIAFACACAVGTARAEPAPAPTPMDESKLTLISGELWIDGLSFMLLGGFARGFGDRSAWSAGLLYGSLPLIAISPSIGHLVTGDDVVGGIGIATSAMGIGIVWAGIHHENDIREHLCATCVHSETAFDLELGAGTLLVLASGTFETFDTIRVVRRHNRRLDIAPMIGGGAQGVMLSGTF